MNAKLNTQELAQRFKVARLAAHSRSVIEAYRYILLEVSKEGYRLTSTDGEMLIQIGEKLSQEGRGRVLLPSAEFASILAAADSEDITIGTDGVVTAGADEWKLSLPDAGEYTFTGVTDRGKSYEADTSELVAAVSVATICIEGNSFRHAGISGVRFDLATEGVVSIVATDGRRLVATDVPIVCEGKADSDAEISVPLKILKAVTSLSGDYGEVAFSLGSTGGISFQSGNVEISGGLINGGFPRWSSVMERYPQTCTASVDASTIISGMSAASIVSDADDSSVLLSIDCEGVHCTGTGNEKGSSSITRSVTTGVEGDASVSARINPSYLTPVLRAIGSRSTVDICSHESAVRVDCGKTRYVLMGVGD